MKHKFPKLDDALFQDVKLEKNLLKKIVGGGGYVTGTAGVTVSFPGGKITSDPDKD